MARTSFNGKGSKVVRRWFEGGSKVARAVAELVPFSIEFIGNPLREGPSRFPFGPIWVAAPPDLGVDFSICPESHPGQIVVRRGSKVFEGGSKVWGVSCLFVVFYFFSFSCFFLCFFLCFYVFFLCFLCFFVFFMFCF